MIEDESDEYIKSIWQEHFEMEVAHLKKASQLLEKYERTPVKKVLPDPNFPKLLRFGENKAYIREILKSVGLTSIKEEYVPVKELPKDSRFFAHLDTVNRSPEDVASHEVIEEYIARFGKDYRYEDKAHPIKSLQCRDCDNITAGRK